MEAHCGATRLTCAFVGVSTVGGGPIVPRDVTLMPGISHGARWKQGVGWAAKQVVVKRRLRHTAIHGTAVAVAKPTAGSVVAVLWQRRRQCSLQFCVRHSGWVRVCHGGSARTHAYRWYATTTLRCAVGRRLHLAANTALTPTPDECTIKAAESVSRSIIRSSNFAWQKLHCSWQSAQNAPARRHSCWSSRLALGRG